MDLLWLRPWWQLAGMEDPIYRRFGRPGDEKTDLLLWNRLMVSSSTTQKISRLVTARPSPAFGGSRSRAVRKHLSSRRWRQGSEDIGISSIRESILSKKALTTWLRLHRWS